MAMVGYGGPTVPSMRAPLGGRGRTDSCCKVPRPAYDDEHDCRCYGCYGTSRSSTSRALSAMGL